MLLLPQPHSSRQGGAGAAPFTLLACCRLDGHPCIAACMIVDSSSHCLDALAILLHRQTLPCCQRLQAGSCAGTRHDVVATLLIEASIWINRHERSSRKTSLHFGRAVLAAQQRPLVLLSMVVRSSTLD